MVLKKRKKIKKRKPVDDSRLLDKPLDRTRLQAAVKPAELGMAPVALEVLMPGEPLPASLYLPLARKRAGVVEVEMSLAASRGDIFQRAWRDRLLKAEQKHVYVSLENAEDLSRYFERNADILLDDPDLSSRRKAMMVQNIADTNLRILFHGNLEPARVEHSVRHTHSTVQRLVNQPQLLDKLTLILRKDFSIYSHSVNVAMLAMSFGRYLGLPESQIESLGMGGMLHDIGWSQLPPALRDKRGQFSENERALMQRHPLLGHQMLLPVSSVPFDVLMIVLHHHENADGTGYPKGLKASRIPYLARLVRVTDAFDAMTSRRIYKDPLSAYDAAATLIQDMTEAFGGDLVPTFVRFLGSPSFAA